MTGKMFSVVMPMLPFCTAIVLLSFLFYATNLATTVPIDSYCRFVACFRCLRQECCAEACPPLIIYAHNARVRRRPLCLLPRRVGRVVQSVERKVVKLRRKVVCFSRKVLHFGQKVGLFSANESDVWIGIARAMDENVE